MKRSLFLIWLAAALANSTALLVIAPGCAITGRSIEVPRLGPATRIEVYEHGRPVVERPIAAGSPEELAITDWLKSHSSGWQRSRVNYAPVRSIRGEDFRLSFVTGRCVLNYRANDRGDWVQVVRTIRDGETIPDVFDQGK